MYKYMLVALLMAGVINLCVAGALSDIPQSANPINNVEKYRANPNELLSDYTETPKELGINENNIAGESDKLVYINQDASDIRDSFEGRPKYKFSEENLKYSSKIINNSKDIIDGVSNKYVDCKNERKCELKYSDKINYCESPIEFKNLKCKRERRVKVSIPQKVKRKVKVSVSGGSKSGATYKYDIRNQSTIYSTYSTPTTKQSASINDIKCNNFSMKLLESGYSADSAQRRVGVTVLLQGTCEQPILYVSTSQGHHNKDKYKWLVRGGYGIIEFKYQPDPIIADSLYTMCPELKKRESLGICKPVKDKCLKAGEEQIIDGVHVKRDCWLYETRYDCKNENTTNTCSKYFNNNCLQVSSDCSRKIGNICTAVKRGFSCAENNCGEKVSVTCGDDIISNEIVEKNTYKVTPEDPKFAESITKLAGVKGAISNMPSDFDENTQFIFQGRQMECREYGFFGVKNCCKDNGWGVDLELTECSSSEKELGKLKEEGRVIFVGNNKHKRKDWEIERNDKRYCVFDSKIARLIQSQGRYTQLNIGFGTGKYPNCRGISPKELSKINLDAINFTEAFGDAISMQAKYDKNSLNKKAIQKIKEYYADEGNDNA